MLLIDKKSSQPLYSQLYEGLKQQILSGELTAGSALTATRKLAREYEISRNTVITAYRQLELEGYIYGTRGSGFYVEALPPQSDESQAAEPFTPPAKERPPHYDFRYGGIDRNVYRNRAFRHSLNNALADLENRNILLYEPPEGLFVLRQWLCRYLKRFRGVRCRPEQVIITSGHHHSLSLITQLMPPEKYEFAMENPGYRGTRDVFSHQDYTMHYVPVGPGGIDLPSLQGLPPSLISITPSHQFPLGQIMPVKHRLELLQLAEKGGHYIIEDDYDSELRYEEQPIPSLQSIDTYGRTFYLGTFSKTMAPDIRLAYVVLPPALSFDFAVDYPFYSSPVPSLLQLAMTDFMESGEYEKQVNALRNDFRKKHALIRSYLEENFPQGVRIHGGGGGMHFVLELRTDCTETEILRRFRQNEVGAYSLRPYWADPDDSPQHQILIGYGAIPLHRLPVNLDALGDTLHDLIQI